MMLQKVQEILADYMGVVPENILSEAGLAADLGLSSFDVVALADKFEDEFVIEIPDRDLQQFVKVNDIVKYLQARQ